MKAYTLALQEESNGAESAREAVSSTWHKDKDLSFHLRHELAGGLRANSFE
jgi:hypothetical protein